MTCPHIVPPFTAGLGLGEGLGLAPTPLYKEGWGRPLPTHLLLNPSRPAALLSLSPSRLRVGEALLQKLSTTCTAPSRCRSNPSLHHTFWTEEGGDVDVPHVCISRRHRHLRC